MENRVLANLEPKKVFAFFEELCQLPHESHKTTAASDWAEKFAKDRSLRYRRDKVGNVVIWKDATPGYEDHPTVMIQGHLDMVCVKDNGVEHDFDKDPLKLFISQESPIGEALIGKHVGDTVDVKTPGGMIQLKVLSISKR